MNNNLKEEEGIVFKYQYDSNNNLIKIIYDNGYIYEYKYEYDEKGNRIKEEYIVNII